MKMYQLPAFRNHRLFEEFICELFNKMENSGNTYQLYGRLGQSQYGVDIYSHSKKTAIQCKLKNINQTPEKIRENLKKEIGKELTKIKKFKHEFNRYIIASTYNDDRVIQDYIINLKNNYNFNISYWGWDTIVRKTNFYRSLLWKYFDILTYNEQKNTKTLLFVSIGGTCRDPIAKAITMKLLKNKKLKQNLIIKTSGIVPGDEISFAAKYVIKHLYNQSIPIDLKPIPINQDLINSADLILLMDDYVMKIPRYLFPNNKTYLFTEFLGSNEKIDDPYPDGKDILTIKRYENTAKQIELILTDKIQYLVDILELDK